MTVANAAITACLYVLLGVGLAEVVRHLFRPAIAPLWRVVTALVLAATTLVCVLAIQRVDAVLSGASSPVLVEPAYRVPQRIERAEPAPEGMEI